MEARVTQCLTSEQVEQLKEQFPIQSELIDYLLFKLMENRKEPIGSLALKLELEKLGLNVGSATIGRSLKIMDSHGYTYQVANKGRMLTDIGIQKIQHLDIDLIEQRLSQNIIKASKAKRNNINDLIDLMIVRKNIECQAVRLAAEKATKEDIKEIEWALSQHRVIVGRKLSPSGAGLDFHIMVVRASKNRFMEAVVKLLSFEERNLEFKTMQLSTTAHATTYVDVHQKVFDAIVERDADLAEKLMREHFDDMINTLSSDLGESNGANV